MEKRFPNRRRNYFIKKKFQSDFIAKFCILVIIGSLISGTTIYLMSKSTLTTTFENSRLVIKSTADFILPAVLLSSLIVIVFIALAIVPIALFASHRIAGPLYRMEKDLEEVSSGNLKKRFSVRKGDELKLLAENLDKMTQSLRTGIADVKRKVLELESTLERSGSVPEELKERLENLKTALSRFNT